jgi:hypothetical protein
MRRQESTFKIGVISGQDFHFSPDFRVIMNMMFSRGGLQLKVGSKQWWHPGIPHIYKVSALLETKK